MHQSFPARNSVKAVCRKFGLSGPEFQLLGDSSHTTFRVSEKIVARVKLDKTPETLSTMQKEVELCHFLASAGAPATRPAQELPYGPQVHDLYAITFWDYELKAECCEAPRIIETLQACLKALEAYPKSVPSYLENVSRCFNLLNTAKGKQFLGVEDHSFLFEIYPKLISGLSNAPKRVLHGDCHLGNVLHTARGPIWTDFESACNGPLEWDLTCLPDKLQNAYQFDPDLYNKLSLLRSWCVAVWCWVDYDKSIEKREAANFHLKRLKNE